LKGGAKKSEKNRRGGSRRQDFFKQRADIQAGTTARAPHCAKSQGEAREPKKEYIQEEENAKKGGRKGFRGVDLKQNSEDALRVFRFSAAALLTRAKTKMASYGLGGKKKVRKKNKQGNLLSTGQK